MISEVSQEGSGPRESLHQMLAALPPHVQKDWVDLHPVISRLNRSLHEPDTEESVLSESKITPQELFDVADLKKTEEGYREMRKKDPSADFFIRQYQGLKQLKQEKGPSDNIFRNTLALSIVAAEEAFSTPDKPFTLWETQRIGLLRLTKNLSDPENPGIVGDMRTGMGKTDALGMVMIPVSLMAGSHVDMNSRTQHTRFRNLKRFQNLGRLMGISSAMLVQTGAITLEKGIPLFTFDQDFAVSGVQVTFTERKDFALYVLNKFHEGSYASVQTITRGGRVCILDEVDAEELDASGVLYIIAGEKAPTPDVIGALWQPREYPFSRDDYNPIPESADPPIPETLFNEYLNKLDHAFADDMGKARIDFQNAEIDADGSLVMSYVILQRLSKYGPDITRQNAVQRWDAKLLTPDGFLTAKGDTYLLRRLYSDITGTTLGGDERIPADWEHFLSTVVPPEISAAVGIMIKMQKGREYYVDKNTFEIQLQSPFTGWPQIGQEYEPLVMFALNAKERAVGEQITIPKFLHNTDDALSPAEFDALMYAKTLGLTGTGISVADWFRRSRGMDVTAIPPQYPERIDEKNAYITVPAGETEELIFDNKMNALGTYLTTLDVNAPVIINVSTKEQETRLFDYLHARFPQDKIDILNAENYEKSSDAFTRAGQAGMKFVVRLMASREVDIAVEELAESAGGLHMISLEPFPLRRQEKQFKGRTGRAGRQGAYRCIVAGSDSVFTHLSKSDHAQVARAITRNDQHTLEQLIRKGQQIYESNLQEENNRNLRMYAPLVTIRRRLVAIDKNNQPRMKSDDFAALRVFWKSFLDVMQTKAHDIEHHSRPTLERSLRDKLWNVQVITVFDQTLDFTKKLMAQSNPALSADEILASVGKYLNEHLGENIGF